MIGLGFRQTMLDWPVQEIAADFFEVAPENWLRRERTPLYRLLDSGREIQLHGVSLNLGGQSPFCPHFLAELRGLMQDLGVRHYSDHLAASGDAHQLHDLFPIPFFQEEAERVSDRIKQVQDYLGYQIAVENSSYYTNIGSISEAEFLMQVVERADCGILLDINNIEVNWKNHAQSDMSQFLQHIDPERVTYLHVAGHEFDPRFGLFIDTHGAALSKLTRAVASDFAQRFGKNILLEWDHDIPDCAGLNEEIRCLRASTTT